MGVFYLKQRDTRPVLEVILKNPDGSVHDLTGATVFKLHVLLATGGTVTRDMLVSGFPTDGKLRYTWLATDWTDPTPLVVGGHRMEYEVFATPSRLTFPNSGYDELRIVADIGQG